MLFTIFASGRAARNLASPSGRVLPAKGTSQPCGFLLAVIRAYQLFELISHLPVEGEP
jgi:hypothetical protein